MKLGIPQTSLWRARGPRLAPGLWLVGDSIFPGQSTAAVALGGARVAQALVGEPVWAAGADRPAASERRGGRDGPVGWLAVQP